MEQDGGSPVTPQRRAKKVPPPVPKKRPKSAPVASSKNGTAQSEEPNPILSVPEEVLVSCDDLTRLPILYDDVVLGCIASRYRQNLFYTWAGPTLVATNPCRPVHQLYTHKEIEHHHHQVKSGIDRRDAHIFSVAGLAHHRLTHDLGYINQAILVSGESGAGKTESARYMLEYLSHIETNFPLVPRSPLKGVWEDKQPQDIQERILASNPILEAFGNAATLRNHNSSRFGKLIRLQYGGRQLRGAEIDTYLLEKTRVTHQTENERNFHIFYQVLAGIKSGDLEGLKAENADQFVIAPKGSLDSDLANLRETLYAFRQLDFSVSHQKQIFQLIMALLHLGNVIFSQDKENHSSWTVNRHNAECLKNLTAACDLLGLEEDKLVDALTIRTISVGTARRVSVFHKPCETEAQCVERRDALMQLIYASLFSHIVTFINTQVSAHRNLWSHFLGVLDVYGFETFDQNSLEQLCINYANERLQQEFMYRYLATEHQVLKEEGFLDVDVPYTDNTDCVVALDSNISVFAILNEECQLKRALKEDEACDRVCKALEDTRVVHAPSSPKRTAGFVVRHYAGPVKYDAKGLLHKNKDEVPLEVRGLLASSSQDFIGGLVSDTSDVDPESGRRTTRKVTTLAKFKASLDTLMRTLARCDLHYVRCLKPNAGSMPGKPDGGYILHQLRACGVIETVRLSQAGYPVRISYEDFISRYGQLSEEDAVSASQEIARSMLGTTPEGHVDSVKCRFGRTRIFLSESALHTLEEVRELKRIQAATCLQKCWRSYKCARRYKLMRLATLVIQKNAKSLIAKQKYQKLKKSCIVIQKHVRGFLTLRKYLQKLKATITLQKYCRGWTARRRYEALVQQNLTRPFSRQSVVSMHSLGYYSLTTSVSGYSINPSLHDVSPCDAAFGEGAVGLGGEALRAYLSPEHRKRLLETEESGIETDTESINGDVANAETKRPRKLRRRAQLQQLLGERRKSKIPRTASDESLDDVSGSHVSPSSGVECSGSHPNGIINSNNQSKSPEKDDLSTHTPSSPLASNIKNYEEEEMTAEDPQSQESTQRLRVATMRSFEDVNGLLKDYSPCENLQMVLPKQNLSLFFKDGVLSYRRMPMVKIKFHTRQTCLPFSHHLPHHERPQGFWDAIR
ncbi:unconventional myosin-XIX-like [Penaeus japonicus]|uniref:unconventional myosin-XIX-like n=1 Tax=Penaeus japonicus TaxID=27405 RepID=UPI001C70F3B1|nr:unconventional myosin-XIX-like [Penaeus japonicus]